jgi:hypothetical protein
MSSRTRRDLCVVERPTGKLAISTPSSCDPNRRRNDMLVVERSHGDLQIVKRHPPRQRPKQDRALTVYQPQQVTVLPPPKSGEQELADAINNLSDALRRPIGFTITSTSYSYRREEPREHSNAYMTAVLNFLTKFG